MMGHAELVTEMEKEELGPLISAEGLEQLQSKYVQSVRVSCFILHAGSRHSVGNISLFIF